MRKVLLLSAVVLAMGVAVAIDVSSTRRAGSLSCALARSIDSYEGVARWRWASSLTAAQRQAKAAEAAERMRAAYRTAEGLTCTAYVYEPPPTQVARVEFKMAPHKLKAEVFIREVGEQRPTFIFTLDEGWFQAVRTAQGGLPMAVRRLPSPRPDGAEYALVAEGDLAKYRCMLGGCLQTWLGSDTWFVETVAGRLTEGEYLGTRREGEEECDVVLYESRWPDYHLVQVFYVTAQGLLARRDTFESVGGAVPAPLRRWTYRNVRIAGLPPETWAPVAAAGVPGKERGKEVEAEQEKSR
jgi:hypothetical protein